MLLGSIPIEGKGMEGNGIGLRETLGCGTATRTGSVGATGNTKPACQSCEL